MPDIFRTSCAPGQTMLRCRQQHWISSPGVPQGGSHGSGNMSLSATPKALFRTERDWDQDSSQITLKALRETPEQMPDTQVCQLSPLRADTITQPRQLCMRTVKDTSTGYVTWR